MLPSGDTVIMIGDRLSLLGDRRGVEGIGKITPLGGATSSRGDRRLTDGAEEDA